MDLKEKVAAMLAERKMLMLGGIAQECGVTEQEAARALPADMRSFCPAGDFDKVWEGISQWPSATFIIQHAGNVVEIKGKIPSGTHGHGYFNLAHGAALGGHIMADGVGEICFLSMPFMGLESHSVQFFGKDGGVMFAIYVGREDHKLIPEARDGFMELKKRFGKEA